MSSNRRAFQAQLAPPDFPRTPGDPPGPPQEFWIKFVFFSKKKGGPDKLLPTYSPSPLAASRPGVTARRGLPSCLNRYTTYHFFDYYGSERPLVPSVVGSVGSVAACRSTSTCAILGRIRRIRCGLAAVKVSTWVGVRWTSRLGRVYVDRSIFAQTTLVFCHFQPFS